MEYLLLIVGLILGFVVSWFIRQGAISGLTEKNKLLENELLKKEEELRQERIIRDTELKKEREISFALNAKLTTAEADLRNLNQRFEDYKKEFIEVKKNLETEFENLANRIFEEKGRVFAEQNKNNLNDILNPLKENIKEFEKKVNEVYDKESKERYSLKDAVKSLVDASQKVSKEANDLAAALKGQSKTMGNWGEFILESILEYSGLAKDREYFIQESLTDDSGKRFQPDVIVKYPGDKSIIIDSKVSLVDYDRYCSEEDEDLKEEFLKAHLDSIKRHINELSKKNYQSIYSLKTIDSVLMFVPIEPAFLLAVDRDKQLWNYAWDKKIILISPSTLIATLKLVQNLWQQENQSKNAIAIAKLGGALYDKLVAFIEDLITVGNKIRDAQNSYQDAMKRLHDGRGNVIKTAEELKNLGAKVTKSLPQQLVDRAD